MAESASSAAEWGDGVELAGSGLDKLTDAIGNAGSFDRTDIHDPQQLSEYKRAKIEADHEGLRGLANSGYHAIFGTPSYQQSMDELTDADRYAAEGDTKAAAALRAQQEHSRLRRLQQGIDSAAASEGETEFLRRRESIDQTLNEALDAADQIANRRTFQSQGFKSQAEASAFANHLMQSAAAIHTAERDKLETQKEIEEASDRSRLDAVNQAGAGDTTGANRTLLENRLNDERMQIDPNDKERLETFDLISRGTLANFDADVARKGKLDKAEIDDKISGFQEESHEADLRSEGKTDDAQIAALRFRTQQQVKSLQEQADATADPTRKTQLQKAIDAATAAGNSELNSLRKELQRESQTSNPNVNPLHDGKDIAPGFADAVKKLDDAATKLDKALSRGKAVQLMSD